MKMYKPTLARIRLRIETGEQVLDSGIVIPTNERSITGSEIGVVEEIGPMAFSPPIGDGEVPFQVGDRVLIKRYAGTEFKSKDGRIRYRMVQDDDILGIDV